MRDDSRIGLGLLALALLCYGSILPSYFLSDDFGFISDLGIDGRYSGEFQRFIRPIKHLSFKFDYALWGLEPLGYHLTNVLAHSAAAFALFLMARRLLQPTRPGDANLPALLAAALFVVLPSHSESVTWISGRSDVLATAFGLFGTGFFLHSLEHGSRARTAVASLGCFAAALLSKEGAIVLPFVWGALFAHAWWRSAERPAFTGGVALVGAFAALALYFVARKWWIGEFIGGYGAARHLAFLQASSLDPLLEFVLRTLLPPMPAELPRWLGQSPQALTRLLAAVLASALLATCWLLRGRFRARDGALLGLLCSCYFMSLVPAISLGVDLFSTQGERFLYLPSAFACLAFVHFGSCCLASRRAAALLFVGLVLLEAALLQSVNRRWLTASRLAEDIVSQAAVVDFASTDVLNLPDSFRGAYVFRVGFPKAIAVMSGNASYSRKIHKTACIHGVESLEERYAVTLRGSLATLTLPKGRRCIRTRKDWSYGSDPGGASTARADVGQVYPGFSWLLAFEVEDGRAVLRRVELPVPASAAVEPLRR